ncbi:MAG: hypothetical protein KAW89_09000, partial [Armatimonadetes bacterium]|nr:hypothetical protein [Armatimonadota bacterium]
TADDEYLINYSNVTFQPEGFSDPQAVRYAVMTQEYDIAPIGSFRYCIPTPPDTDNPWILYRMEGERRKIDTDGDGIDDRYVFGACDSPGQFVIGYWSSRNALTPARGADIPVTRTICLDAAGYLVLPPSPPAELGQLWAKGYVARGDLDDNGTDDIDEAFVSGGVMLIYIHDGVKFGPLRVENERLADAGSGDTTSFNAEYGHWLGLPNPVATGTYSIGEVTWDPMGVWPSFPMLINSSELRPRIVVRREGYAGGGGEDYNASCLLDTDELDPSDGGAIQVVGGTVINNMFGISWNSSQGTVTLASNAGPAIIDFSQGTYKLSSLPPPDEVWSSPGTNPDPWGGTAEPVIGTDVYDEDIVHTALS